MQRAASDEPQAVPGFHGGNGRVRAVSRTRQGGRQCRGRRAVPREVVACSYCHAGQRRGSADGARPSAGVDGNMERELVRSAVARSTAVYFRKGIAPKTKWQYKGVWRRYEDLCHRMGEDPLPVMENKAIAYVVTVADEGVQALHG